MHRAEKSTSKLCRDRELDNARRIHKVKINQIRSNIDTSRPRTLGMKHMQHNPKKERLLQERLIEINRENANLVRHMKDIQKQTDLRQASIISTTSIVPSIEKIPARPKTERSLHSSYRARRLREIDHDNRGIAERLKSTKTHYQKKLMNEEWKRNLSYLRSICQYPVLSASRQRSPLKAKEFPRLELPIIETTTMPRVPPTRDQDEEFEVLAIDMDIASPEGAVIDAPEVHSPQKTPETKQFRQLKKKLSMTPALPPLYRSSHRHDQSLSLASPSKKTPSLFTCDRKVKGMHFILTASKGFDGQPDGIQFVAYNSSTLEKIYLSISQDQALEYCPSFTAGDSIDYRKLALDIEPRVHFQRQRTGAVTLFMESPADYAAATKIQAHIRGSLCRKYDSKLHASRFSSESADFPPTKTPPPYKETRRPRKQNTANKGRKKNHSKKIKPNNDMKAKSSDQTFDHASTLDEYFLASNPSEEQEAAVQIQALVRGNRAREEYKNLHGTDVATADPLSSPKRAYNDESAAVLIQATARGRQTRKQVVQKKQQEDTAATKLQAQIRGRSVRRQRERKEARTIIHQTGIKQMGRYILLSFRKLEQEAAAYNVTVCDIRCEFSAASSLQRPRVQELLGPRVRKSHVPLTEMQECRILQDHVCLTSSTPKPGHASCLRLEFL